MLAPSPSVQLQTEGQQSEIGAAPGLEPSLTGPAPALWAGFAAFVIVFVVVLMLIIRGRVIRPAARKAAAPADFFEPAGEAAEITFDDDAPVAQQDRHLDTAAAGKEETKGEKAEAGKAETRPKRSAFSGLFAKKPKSPPDAPAEANAAPEDASPQNAAHDLLAGEEEEFAAHRTDEETVLRSSSQSIPAQLKTMDDDVEARRREAEEEELRRLEAREEAAETRRRERTAAAALAAFPRARAGQEKTQAQPSHQNRPAQQPDPQQFASMQRALETAFADRLDSLAQDMHHRLGALGAQLETLSAAASHTPDKPEFEGVSEAHFAEFANLIGEQLETLRETSTTSIDALSRRLDRLDAAPEGLAALSKNVARLNMTLGGNMAATTAGRLQLADILANALPPGRYALARKLSSGKTADALVHAAETSAPVAIDARFPVEAFDAYEQSRIENGQVEAAETEFRRLMLRQIVDIAEKQIAPGETADCALMFIPSEHMLTTLYTSFSDIVQESYRARIWMVSPSSLTASLYTISALINAQRGDEERIVENTGHGSIAEMMNGAHGEEQAGETPAPAANPAVNTEADIDANAETQADSAPHADDEGKAAETPAQTRTPSGADETPPFPLR